MMTLRYSTTSPYVRKVTVVAHEAGQHDSIERVPTLPWDPKTDLPKDNPLGKVPALVTPDGTFYDSPVICEYLDAKGGRKLYPAAGPARWAALRRQALADGMLDAGISWLLESRRQAGEQSRGWMERQQGIVRRGFDALEAEAGKLDGPVDIGTIAVGCAIGWLEFRNILGADWRQGRPSLARWYEGFARRPSMLATIPKEPA
ncbi:MAG: glutathione S-transferase N-terminal domain-containing protein [Dongiaceae bacterium]